MKKEKAIIQKKKAPSINNDVQNLKAYGIKVARSMSLGGLVEFGKCYILVFALFFGYFGFLLGVVYG